MEKGNNVKEVFEANPNITDLEVWEEEKGSKNDPKKGKIIVEDINEDSFILYTQENGETLEV